MKRLKERAQSLHRWAKPALLLLGVVFLGTALGAFYLWDGGEYTLSTFSMGSQVRQTVYGPKKEEAAAQAAQAVTALENLISWRIDGSDTAKINENAGNGTLPIDPRAEQVLSVSKEVWEKSGGAFDPTVGPVSRLWDFDGTPQVPEEEALAEALSHVDGGALSLPGDGTAALGPGAFLDLGAVGKGAACDAVLLAWEKAGASRGVVSVGGSVGLYGRKAFGRPWTIGVRDPAGNGLLGELKLSGGCVSTSGSYEKTFTQAGKTYHHLLDPRTGFPAQSGLVSVTVWCGERPGENGALSDALATACFILGEEQSLPLLDAFGAGAVFVTEDKKVLVTENLREAFFLTSPDYGETAGGAS